MIGDEDAAFVFRGQRLTAPIDAHPAGHEDEPRPDLRAAVRPSPATVEHTPDERARAHDDRVERDRRDEDEDRPPPSKRRKAHACAAERRRAGSSRSTRSTGRPTWT